MDEYNPPYGATLPPYSQDNPNKEFSPPLYENLAADYEEIDAENLPTFHIGGHQLRAATSASYLADILVNTPPQEYESLEYDGELEAHECATMSLRHMPNSFITDGDGYSLASSRHFREPSGHSSDSSSHVRNPSTSSSRHVRNSSLAVSEITIADEDDETVRYITDLRSLRPARSMEEPQLQYPHDAPSSHHHHHNHHHHHQTQHKHTHSHSVDCSDLRNEDTAQSPVTMTSSSACLLDGASSKRSGLSVHRSQGSNSCPQTPHNSRTRRCVSPSSVQKRTYISWI